MCLRGVECRHEVEKNGVAMMINEIEIICLKKVGNVRGVYRTGNKYSHTRRNCRREYGTTNKILGRSPRIAWQDTHAPPKSVGI